jgi:3-phenylpropionate/trans-cinnamate dioxygenase ferredoxin reductase subunit
MNGGLPLQVTAPPSVALPRKQRRDPARQTIVIVGAGQAGAQAAYALREHGFVGRIVLVGDEGQAPYQRPPLSKNFLARELSVERLYLRPLSFYSSQDIELKLRARVERVDPQSSRILLHDGARIGYDKLLLATGSRPRVLQVPGSRGADIHYLRTVQDALRLRAQIAPGRRIAIVGGGYIGLEVAAIACAGGAVVSVLEAENRVLGRVTTSAVSEFFAAAHRAHGVAIRCNERVTAFEAGERLEAIVCGNATEIADLAIIGIGAEPNVELARNAGLACDDGVVVDEHCRTSYPNIFAAGDCTSHFNALLGRRLRLESVQNAVDQATNAAINMTGKECPYAAVPWFWSNQYEHKLQTAGSFDGYDEIEVRGSRESGRFALLYRKQGALLAVDAVNMPREYMAVRKELRESGQPGVRIVEKRKETGGLRLCDI